jgi:sulfite exporter TauE/SafE
MVALFSQAFLLGLSMGPACLGFCSPVCAPYIASENRGNWGGSARVLALFLIGRLFGYSLVGAAIGLAGAAILHSTSPHLWSGVRLTTGLMMILFGIMTRAPVFRWCARTPASHRSGAFAVVLGFLSGVNLCPPFAAAIAGAVSAASAFRSIFYFWSFFAGTSICFIPLIFLGRFSRLEEFRLVARICLFLVGFWLTFEGGFHLMA